MARPPARRGTRCRGHAGEPRSRAGRAAERAAAWAGARHDLGPPRRRAGRRRRAAGCRDAQRPLRRAAGRADELRGRPAVALWWWAGPARATQRAPRPASRAPPNGRRGAAVGAQPRIVAARGAQARQARPLRPRDRRAGLRHAGEPAGRSLRKPARGARRAPRCGRDRRPAARGGCARLACASARTVTPSACWRGCSGAGPRSASRPAGGRSSAPTGAGCAASSTEPATMEP